jgi:hypothetical protein
VPWPEDHDGCGQDRESDEDVRAEAEADSEDEAREGANENTGRPSQPSRSEYAGQEERDQEKRCLRVVAKVSKHGELQRREDQDDRSEGRQASADEETEDAEERRPGERVEHGKERDERLPGDVIYAPNERHALE